MKRRIKDGFSILLPAADPVQMFGANIKLSRIVVVTQAHHQPRLIIDLLAKQTKVHLVLMALQIDRLPRSRCSLGQPSLAYSGQSGRRNRSRVPSGFQNLTSHMRITTELSSCPRWAQLRMSPHRCRDTRATPSALNWS